MKFGEIIESKMGRFVYLKTGKELKSKNMKDLLKELKADGVSKFSPLGGLEADHKIPYGQTIFVSIDPYAEDVSQKVELLMCMDKKKLEKQLRQRAMDI